MVAQALPLPIERLNDTRRRIHRVVDFIDEHIDGDIALPDLADIACMSRFHFQRVYARLVGATPGETIRSLRLLRARDRIVFEGASVEEAASQAGFDSLPVFVRAYRREFDRSPSEINILPHPLARPQPLDRFTIVERRPQPMFTTSWYDERLAMDPLLINTQAYARYLTSDAEAKALAIYHDDFFTPYDREFRADLCFPLGKSMQPDTAGLFETVTVPGGLYACVEQRGLLLDLVPHWDEFENRTLPQAGWRRRAGPVLRWFYSDRAITPPSQRLAYLYIPVEAATTH